MRSGSQLKIHWGQNDFYEENFDCPLYSNEVSKYFSKNHFYLSLIGDSGVAHFLQYDASTFFDNMLA